MAKRNPLKRTTVEEEIFSKTSQKPIKIKEIGFNLKGEDIIMSGHDEGYYSENNSWEPHYYLKVIRPRVETDEEYKIRLEGIKEFKEESKKRRYKTYLNLKKEFEKKV